jgi:hypothetical protein
MTEPSCSLVSASIGTSDRVCQDPARDRPGWRHPRRRLEADRCAPSVRRDRPADSTFGTAGIASFTGAWLQNALSIARLTGSWSSSVTV